MIKKLVKFYQKTGIFLLTVFCLIVVYPLIALATFRIICPKCKVPLKVKVRDSESTVQFKRCGFKCKQCSIRISLKKAYYPDNIDLLGANLMYRIKSGIQLIAFNCCVWLGPLIDKTIKVFRLE